MGVRRSILVSTVIAALCGLFAVTAPAAEARESALLPVPYGLLTGVSQGLTNPYSDPPGSNDWNCHPSAAHPEPVVLVHGLIGSKTTNWQTMSPLLANNGYCVYAFTYGQPGPSYPLDQVGGFTPMESSARTLDAFVTRVLAASGARKVDLVGHSEGTIMPEYWLQFLGGAAKTDRYVAVTPIYDGTLAPPVPVLPIAEAFGLRDPITALVGVACQACTQLVHGSPYMQRMRAAGVKVAGVTYTTVMTRYDELVLPYWSGYLEGATNITVQDGCEVDFSDHLAIITSRRTGQVILNALDPAHARSLPCEPVAPILGSEIYGSDATKVDTQMKEAQRTGPRTS